MHNHKLSLPMAILINTNIMMGSGIFLNTVILARNAGSVGFISYLIVGLMLLPLVLTIAKLVELHPAGGFYTFASKELSPFFGFITTWGYLTAKLAAATIMIHTCVGTLQLLIPVMGNVSPFIIDIVILGLFLSLNMLHMKTGGTIQAVFTTGKALPIAFALLAGLFLFDSNNFTAVHQLWSGIPLILPIAIYGVMGFESACSLSSKISNAHKNGPLVIFFSYAINMILLMTYQLLFYGSLGTTLANATSYREMYPGLMGALLPSNPVLALKIGGLFNIAVATSILGGAYGIIFSNAWNLYALAEHKHMFFSKILTTFNRYSIPFVCILVEGLICLIFLALSHGKQEVLQGIGALGVVFTYTMSALALLKAKHTRPDITISSWIPRLGLLNCIVLVGICLAKLYKTGPTSLYGFILLFILGTLMYAYTKYTHKASPEM